MNIHFNLSKAMYMKGDLDESVIQLRHAVEIEKNLGDPDLDQDMTLLLDLEQELAMPRIIRWFRRKITFVENNHSKSQV